MKYLNVFVKLRNPFGKLVDGVVIIRNEFALCKFEDEKLSKQLYKLGKKKGDDVAYNEEHKAMVQRYKGKTIKQILKIIKEELGNAGGEVLKTKNEN